jgi:antitoxin component of MazEF toxin-antitoxin module
MPEDNEFEIRVKDGPIITKTKPKPALEALVAAITLENRHQEQQWFNPAGNEAW